MKKTMYIILIIILIPILCLGIYIGWAALKALFVSDKAVPANSPTYIEQFVDIKVPKTFTNPSYDVGYDGQSGKIDDPIEKKVADASWRFIPSTHSLDVGLQGKRQSGLSGYSSYDQKLLLTIYNSEDEDMETVDAYIKRLWDINSHEKSSILDFEGFVENTPVASVMLAGVPASESKAESSPDISYAVSSYAYAEPQAMSEDKQVSGRTIIITNSSKKIRLILHEKGVTEQALIKDGLAIENSILRKEDAIRHYLDLVKSAASSATSTQTQGQGGLGRFTSPDGSFGFLYPEFAGWETKEIKKGTDNQHIIVLDYPDTINLYQAPQIIITHMPVQELTNRRAPGSTALDTFNARGVHFEMIKDQSNAEKLALYGDDIGVTVSTTAPDGNGFSQEELFQKIIKTFLENKK